VGEEVVEEVGEEKRGKEHREEEIRMTLDFISMLEAEGVSGREVATMYYSVARMLVREERRKEALPKAERGLEIDRDCLGEDHSLYVEADEFVQSL
jgi:carbamoylphosphate synthase large subunit